MKKHYLILSLFAIALTWHITSFAADDVRAGWAPATANIVNIMQLDNGTYSYTIEYTTARNTIKQRIINARQKPIANQRVEILYQLDDPTIFELREPIKFPAH